MCKPTIAGIPILMSGKVRIQRKTLLRFLGGLARWFHHWGPHSGRKEPTSGCPRTREDQAATVPSPSPNKGSEKSFKMIKRNIKYITVKSLFMHMNFLNYI